MIKVNKEQIDYSGSPIQILSEISFLIDTFKRQSIKEYPGVKSRLEEMMFATICMPIFFDDFIDNEDVDLNDHLRKLYEVTREEVTNIRMEIADND